MEEEDCCDGGFLLPTPHRCYGDKQELTLQQSRAHWSSTGPSVTEALITQLIPTSFLMLKVLPWPPSHHSRTEEPVG